jgi:hypothetical protein
MNSVEDPNVFEWAHQLALKIHSSTNHAGEGHGQGWTCKSCGYER